MKLILDPRHATKSVLGYAQLELLSFGYNQEGILQSVLCMSELGLVDIREPELSEDLSLHYIPAVKEGLGEDGTKP